MKILSLSHRDNLFSARVLIHNVERDFSANSLDHLTEKILHRDKFASKEDVTSDIKLNYPEIYDVARIA